MPLPDERPRQSVANLIGRFEQQTKRQSLTGTPPPPLVPSGPQAQRVSSVVSNHTGDSAKEEVKETREWPPKLKLTTASVVPDAPNAETEKVPSPVLVSAPEPVVQESVAESTAMVEATPAEPEAKSPKSPQSEPVPEPVPPAKPVTSQSTRTAPNTPAKAKAHAASKAPIKATRPPAKSPPTSFHATLSASASTPPSQIKPSPSASARSAAAARPRPSSSASNRPPMVPKTPSTPSRPKTPSMRPKTPSVARPKTPATSKLPPSGLFAPTAASLARARNAPSPVPTSVKRLSLGPDVAERLSKPTASSISKARAPTMTSPPKPSAAKLPARGVPATTRNAKVAAKSKAAATIGAKNKEQKAAAATTSPEAPHSEPEDEHPEIEDEHSEVEYVHEAEAEREREGSATTSATLVDTAIFVHEPEAHEVLEKEVVYDEPSEHEHHDNPEDHHEEPTEHSIALDEELVPAEEHHEPVEETESLAAHHAPEVATASHDDLDAIINMLETKPLISTELAAAASTSPVKQEHVNIDEIPDIDEY